MYCGWGRDAQMLRCLDEKTESFQKAKLFFPVKYFFVHKGKKS
jgi:hypothetical protein